MRPQPGDVLTGRLVAAGSAPYRFEPGARRSFYVRIETTAGTRDLWGADLERALAQSSTRPGPGDEVGIQFRGSKVVNVPVQARTDPTDPPRTKNLWRIESRAFFEERRAAAQALRERTPEYQREPARPGPMLDALVILRAAELFAQSRIEHPADRIRFESAIRQTLATTIELGDRIPAIRIRAAAATQQDPADDRTTRTPTHRGEPPPRDPQLTR